MSLLTTENTALLSNDNSKSNGYYNGHFTQQPKQQNGYSHYIDVLDKPLYNAYTPVLAELDFSAGLSLQELLPFVDDPWWQKLRRTLFGTCVLVFWLILFTACTLAYMQHDQQCSTIIDVVPITTTTAARALQKN
ncbi:uncharacterized protein LOC118737687 [Rhagoletis pomonella]|uniref:uncharacterized protein LOC118737687 n=1 Tax=Rhagoletis pomonella TaxID=28610 RepID=UPI0017801F93|nr:uncharacterized protein LOC118737687 [Rhagoletis pomonella]